MIKKTNFILNVWGQLATAGFVFAIASLFFPPILALQVALYAGVIYVLLNIDLDKVGSKAERLLLPLWGQFATAGFVFGALSLLTPLSVPIALAIALAVGIVSASLKLYAQNGDHPKLNTLLDAWGLLATAGFVAAMLPLVASVLTFMAINWVIGLAVGIVCAVIFLISQALSQPSDSESLDEVISEAAPVIYKHAKRQNNILSDAPKPLQEADKLDVVHEVLPDIKADQTPLSPSR